MTCNRIIYQIAIKNQREGMMAGVKGHRKKVTRLEVTLADLPQVSDGVSAYDSDERRLHSGSHPGVLGNTYTC